MDFTFFTKPAIMIETCKRCSRNKDSPPHYAERMDMMEILDKISDTIVTVSKDATQKAKDLSELARIRMEMRAKQDYINKQYQEMGKAYYEKHKDDVTPKYEQIALIKDAEDVIDELRLQLSEIKGTQRCPQCGQDMSLDADYCSKCGAKLNIFEEEE